MYINGNNDLKRRIRELREENGYTKEQVANFLNVDTITYSSYETGHKVPNSEILRDLRDFYKIRAELLGASLPISVNVECSKELLESFAKSLREVVPVETKTNEELMMMQKALKRKFNPIHKNIMDALELPELTERFTHDRGDRSIAVVSLDAQVEKLIFKYLKIQEIITDELLKRFM